MQQTIEIRTKTLGGGRPWIIVPIVGASREEIFQKAREIAAAEADMAEWRADFYEHVFERAAIMETLFGLREILGEIPLLFTFRTRAEGGEKEIAAPQYAALNRAVAESGLADAVDVEIMAGDALVADIIKNLHACRSVVVASNHDFHATPAREEILRRLTKMQEMGADVLKIAVMPQSSGDVLTLMLAVCEMVETRAQKPVVAMSMSALGVVSRIAGEAFGSAMTFGALGKTSAPGQIPVAELRRALDILHNSMQTN